MSNHNLFTLSADGAAVPASSEAILIAARQVLAHRVRRGASLQSPQKTGEYLMARLGHLDYEVFGLILLDLCGVHFYVHNSFKQPYLRSDPWRSAAVCCSPVERYAAIASGQSMPRKFVTSSRS
jgi:hypothetical protein